MFRPRKSGIRKRLKRLAGGLGIGAGALGAGIAGGFGWAAGDRAFSAAGRGLRILRRAGTLRKLRFVR